MSLLVTERDLEDFRQRIEAARDRFVPGSELAVCTGCLEVVAVASGCWPCSQRKRQMSRYAISAK